MDRLDVRRRAASALSHWLRLRGTDWTRLVLASEAEGHWFESSSARQSTSSEAGLFSGDAFGASPAFSAAGNNRVTNGVGFSSFSWPIASRRKPGTTRP